MILHMRRYVLILAPYFAWDVVTGKTWSCKYKSFAESFHHRLCWGIPRHGNKFEKERLNHE